MNNQSLIAPVSQGERVRELDIIRGFALFGILLANMAYFAAPSVYMVMTKTEWWPELWHQTAEVLILFFASGKFFTMFSFLFGLGFIIFLQRVEQKTSRPRTIFFRRLVILFGIGLIHAFGLWYGDILIVYSVIGVLLFLFSRRKAKTVLKWAYLVLLIPVAAVLFFVLVLSAQGGAAVSGAESAAFAEERISGSLAAYGSGTFTEIMGQRAADYSLMLTNYAFMVPIILSMFLFGVYIAKTGRFQQISAQLPFYKKIWLITLAIGLPFNILAVYSYVQLDSVGSGLWMAYYAGMAVGGPALCFFYMTSIILLCQKKVWNRILSPLQAVGRLALSNYLIQSVVCTTIFYNYGFGLYGKLGPLFWVIITLVLFALQIWGSGLWLKTFQFGPAEWLWRSLTYGRRQPLVKRANKNQAP